MAKQLCVVTEMGVKSETVGTHVGSDHNVYQKWVELSFRPLSRDGPFLRLSTEGQEREYPHDKFDEASLATTLDSWKKRVNIGDKVELEETATQLQSYLVIPESIVLVSTFFEDIFREMYRVADRNGIPLQVGDTWCHSTFVWAYAKEIADKAIKNGHEVDLDFLRRATYVHDFGRMIVGSDASRKLGEYYRHGVEGRDYISNLLRDPTRILEPATFEEAEKLARVCERHIGGSGFIAETNQKLGLGQDDTLAETIEEKIIGYADWRTHAMEVEGNYPPRIFIPTRVDYETAILRTRRIPGIHPKQIKKAEELHTYIQEIIK